MAMSNHINNVAIVGVRDGLGFRLLIVGRRKQASGNVGKFITDALLTTGKHTVTAITRADGQSKVPQGVMTKQVDYSNPETLVNALKGQEALIITLSGMAPQDTETKLVHAAGEAGVPWILPSEWAPDTANEALVKDVFIFRPKVAIRKAIEDLGKSSYIAISTGFWYEYTLAMPASFGIDFAKRTATLFDEGETKISISTWPQIGRAVANLLSLPINPEGSNKQSYLNNFRNRVVYINSFTISQKDMLASAVRVTDTQETEWTVTKEPARERYTNGIKEIQEGKRMGYAKMMYTRVFYPDGCGDVEHTKGTINGLLGLPKEDLDDATKVAIERSQRMKQWVDQ